ncbi:hypothetical protein EDD73_1153 [Heliophilum fasciatum]|uniref:Uncharacterized protein n=1 Tax=Heliophilum fasciatum TaxID=35700 RepID=A0A4R2RN78_9FIRM|nr:hypothetical protein [Heliophilum fasciatum]TCP63757.1 hypothetical protein EDD73_1153 [Heliophilum fasciatum]
MILEHIFPVFIKTIRPSVLFNRLIISVFPFWLLHHYDYETFAQLKSLIPLNHLPGNTPNIIFYFVKFFVFFSFICVYCLLFLFATWLIQKTFCTIINYFTTAQLITVFNYRRAIRDQLIKIIMNSAIIMFSLAKFSELFLEEGFIIDYLMNTSAKYVSIYPLWFIVILFLLYLILPFEN